MRHRALALLLALAMAGFATAAFAQAPEPEPAPPDTALDDFLGELSDSTDLYFGDTAAPLDTAGLDTVLTDVSSEDTVEGVKYSVIPSFAFNRVDGPVPGITLGITGPRKRGARLGYGKLGMKLAYATGPNDFLGGVEYTNRLRLGATPYDLRVFGGRVTTGMNRDHGEKIFSTVRAFLTGRDFTQYYRHDGWLASVTRDRGSWRAGVTWRDMLESPLPVTATWNLFKREPATRENLQAAFGRTREIGLDAGVRVPVGFPMKVEAAAHVSDPSIGSAFDYRRVRAAAGAEIPLGRVAAVVPQVAWGRLDGDAIPQASFFIGGSSTIRSLNRDTRGGTRMAIAKLDLIGTGDLFGFLHKGAPSAFPIQAGAFVAAGTTWGVDPFGGRTIPGEVFPHTEDMLAEAGIQLLYSSALFTQGGMVRLSYAWPLGPDGRDPKFSISVSRALDLLRPINGE